MNQLLSSLSVAQLRRAIEIREKIEALEKELVGIQGVSSVSSVAAPAASGKKRTMSPAARAKIAAAQKARWAERKGKKSAAPAAKAVAKSEPKPKRKLTAAGRRRLAALAKARWMKARAAGKTSLAA